MLSNHCEQNAWIGISTCSESYFLYYPFSKSCVSAKFMNEIVTLNYQIISFSLPLMLLFRLVHHKHIEQHLHAEKFH